MRRFLLIAGLFALAVGLLWIGQGTGTVALAAIELHGQPAAMGRLWRSHGRLRAGADLAEQPIEETRE